MKGGDKLIKSEVFPVNISAIPELHAYEVELAGSTEQLNKVGGKLAYRLKKKFGGHWVWVREDKKLITDLEPIDEREINTFISELRRSDKEKESFKYLNAIRYVGDWEPTPIAKARYVEKLFDELQKEIKNILSKYSYRIENVYIERLCDVQALTVKNGSAVEPAIALSISSELVYEQDLKGYIEELKRKNVNIEDELKGLLVYSKFQSLKGEITEIVGELKYHRERLLDIASEQEIIDLINKAPDDELIVRVKTKSGEYDYIISALGVIVHPDYVRKFTRDNKSVNDLFNKLKIEPNERYRIIEDIYKVLKDKGWLGEPYSSQSFPNLFIKSKDIGFSPNILIGNNKKTHIDRLWFEITKNGIYAMSEKFHGGEPINLGIINAIYNKSRDVEGFLKSIEEELKRLGFKTNIAGYHQLKVDNSDLIAFRRDLNDVISKIDEKNKPDIYLVFFPGEPREDDYDGFYDELKMVCLKEGLQSQVVYERTIGNKFALRNIVLGIIGKTGNKPYILEESLDFADYLVGLDRSGIQKDKLAGTINVVGFVRIYQNNGEFLRYKFYNMLVEGETIPEKVLNSLFNDLKFENKKVIIHRDGLFRGNEIEVLKKIAHKLNSEFYFIEVIKNDVPRIYEFDNGIAKKAEKGTAFKLNDKEAILVTSSPQKGTPRPLKIRTDGKLDIEKAIHSVLSMTILHYGSLIQPRLPVTTYYADKIGKFILRGIEPKEPEGNIPFWL